MKKQLLLPTLLISLLSLQTKAQTITTFAGGAVMLYGGDGSTATAAFLNQPSGVATDGTGNLYIADQWNNRVRMVTPAGIISTFAGNGTAVYGGDGGAATSAGISHPNSLAVDAAGNVYISDGDNRVRKVNTSGIITTVAGNGTPAYSGDGTAATAASLNAPAGLAIDATGNLYIADMSNHRIRKVNSTGIISTITGNGTSGFSGDGGPATAATLNSPTGVVTDASGNLYIADRDNNRIRKINASANISTIAGDGSMGGSGDGGPATAAALYTPSNLCIYGGSIYIADMGNSRVRAINAAGIINAVASGGGSGFAGDGGPATAALLSGTMAVAFRSTGDMYVADQRNNRIRHVNASGIINTIAGTIYLGDGGPATAATIYATDMCMDPTGIIYATDASNNIVRKIDLAGIITTIAGQFNPGFSGDGGPATAAQLTFPSGITCDAAGNVYFVDAGNHRVRKIDAAGMITTVAGGLPGYSGDGGPAIGAGIATAFLATDGSGNLYLSETTVPMKRIRKVDAAGIITTFAGNGTTGYTGDGGPATNAQLGGAGNITTDAAGNVYITDQGNKVIRKVDNAGIITTVAGNGTSGYTGDGGPATAASMDYPHGLDADNSGNLLIVDQMNHAIRSVNSAGIITTIAGNGTPGHTGDGGPATAAQIGYPSAIKADAAGNIYVYESFDGVIRKITGVPSLKTMQVSENNTIVIPNPACNEFSLSAQNTINSIVMTDMAGRVVLNNTYSSKNVRVNITQLKSGIYTVIINGGEIKRLVKE